MADSWHIDLQGPSRDKWVWLRVDERGTVLARSRGSFDYYLDVLRDAQRNGLKDEPKFGPPAPPSCKLP